jgi:hypothetical protein
MSSNLPRALVVHAMPGRARLRIDERKGDAGYFDRLGHELAEHAAVRSVHVTTATSSVLVLHEGALESILDHAAVRGLFVATVAPARAPMRRLRDGIDVFDARLARATDGAVSLSGLTFVGLVGAGMWQVRRGMVLPAALTVFANALKALDRAADTEAQVTQERSSRVTRP